MKEKVIKNICNLFNLEDTNYENIVNVSKMIKDNYKEYYNSSYIYKDKNYFENVKFKIFIKSIENINMISEKIIKRNNEILLNKKYRSLNPDLYDYCVDFSAELFNLIDIETFYMMEYCHLNNIELNEHEISCLDFMFSLSEFYLEETNEIVNLINTNKGYVLKRNK